MTSKAEAEKELQRAILIVAVVMIIALLVGVSLFINGAFNLNPAYAPNAPVLKSATAGDRNVTLAWNAPDWDGGQAVSGYRVYYGASPPLTLYAEYGADTLSAGVSGLEPGIRYSFAVAAVNPIGTSAQSNIVNVTACTTPSAPALVSAEPWNGTIILCWQAPVSNGSSQVTGYRISVDSLAGPVLYDDIQKAEFPQLVYYIEQLVPQAPVVIIQVAAVNAAGVGAYSNAMTVQR
jgi:hypothetical protein